MRKGLLDRYRVINDPVHKYVKIYKHEVPILESYAFQRLKRIKHLAVTDSVYPGATYTTFLHSIGVAHVAENMAREILMKAGVGYDDVERYIVLTRLVALLHDIGYGPYTHVFEESILRPRRLTHEDVGAKIVEDVNEIAVAIEKVLKECGYTCSHIAQAVKSRNVSEWPFKSIISGGVSEKVLFHLFKGAFSANTIDRILRDSYYTGVANYATIDWKKLVYYTIAQEDAIIFDSRAMDVLEQILISKARLILQVHYDPGVRGVSRFCGNILRNLDQKKLIDFDKLLEDVSKYLELDDYTIFSREDIRSIKDVRYLIRGGNPYTVLIDYNLPYGVYFETMDVERIEYIVSEHIRSCGIELEKDVDLFVDSLDRLVKLIAKDCEIPIRYEDGSITSTRLCDLLHPFIRYNATAFRVYVKKDVADKVYDIRYKIWTSINEEIMNTVQ